jgi:hypothetical protein
MGNHNGIKELMAVPTKEAVTESQILPILATLQTICPMLTKSIDIEYERDMDGGAASALAMVVIKACNLLGDIFDESSRYSVADTKLFFDTLQKSHEAQIEFLKSQKLASEEVLRPSFQLRPTIGVHENSYFAYWGDASTENGSIIGVGPTPAAALLDFDAAFHRAPNEQVFKISANVDAPPPQPEDTAETPEEFNKKRRKKK